MNKIYKVVWSKVKNCYVVVSEIAKNVISGSVKSAKVGTAPVVKGMALGALMAFVITGNAWADDYYKGHYYIFSTHKELTEDTSRYSFRSFFVDNEPGVFNSINGNGHTFTLTGGHNDWDPYGKIAFFGYGGIMRLMNVDKVEFTGDYDYGIQAHAGNYTLFTNIGNIIQTSGRFTNGYFIRSDGSTIELDAKNIDVDGGILATDNSYSFHGHVYSTIDINVDENITLDGNVVAGNQSVVNIKAKEANFIGEIRSKSGSVINLTADKNKIIGGVQADGENSRINIKANVAGNVVGDVSASNGGGVSLDLSGDGSSFSGKVDIDASSEVLLDLSEGATWNVLDKSLITTLSGNNGVIKIGKDFQSTDSVVTINNNLSTNAVVKVGTSIDFQNGVRKGLEEANEIHKNMHYNSVTVNDGNNEFVYEVFADNVPIYGDVELRNDKVVTTIDTDDLVVQGDVFAGNGTRENLKID